MYLVPPSEQTRCIDVWMGVVFIVWYFDVVPHAVVYPRHDANQEPNVNNGSLDLDSAKLVG